MKNNNEVCAPQMVCLGVNYRTSPVAVREQFAVAKSRLQQADAELCALPAIEECVLLSTCNRTELYFWTHDPEEAAHGVLSYFG